METRGDGRVRLNEKRERERRKKEGKKEEIEKGRRVNWLAPPAEFLDEFE